MLKYAFSLVFLVCSCVSSSDPEVLAEQRSSPILPCLAADQSSPSGLKKGASCRDATAGLLIRRITDHKNEAPRGFARIDYSRRQAINCDDSLMLVYARDGYWHLYQVKDAKYLKRLDGPASDAELIWDPLNPRRVYYMPLNGGMTLYALDVDSNQTSKVASFSGRLPWKNAARAWTKSEGSPSADGRYWGFQVEDDDFKPLGLMVWDKEKDVVLGTLDFASQRLGRPDHTSMSPSGEFIVASWDDGIGTTAFTRDFTRRVQLHHKSEHSDLALLPNGHDAYVSVDYQSNRGDVFMVDLQTGVRSVLFHSYIDGTATAMHFSGKAFDFPGWVVLSTYSASGAKPVWLHNRIFAVSLSNNPQIIPLAHHYARVEDYWGEPHATVSRDFRLISFNSNWSQPASSDIDVYQLRLDPQKIPELSAYAVHAD